jgi:hypothetical protein
MFFILYDSSFSIGTAMAKSLSQTGRAEKKLSDKKSASLQRLTLSVKSYKIKSASHHGRHA